MRTPTMNTRSRFMDGIARKLTKYTPGAERMSLPAHAVGFALLLGLSLPATAAVNASFSSTALQNDFIANATNQYNATIVPSPYFPGTYSLAISGKKDVSASTTCVSVQDFQALVSTLTVVSKGNYVYCFATGMEYERNADLRILSRYSVDCSTATTCSEAVNNAYNTIYQQFFSTPTLPGGY